MNWKEEQAKNKRDKLFSPRYFLFDAVRFISILPTIVMYRPKFYYSSPAARKKVRGPALVISNHCSFLDGFRLLTAMWYRRVNIVITSQMFQYRRLRWILPRMQCISVDTQRPGVPFFNDVVERLERGCAVGIYPEGHINREAGQMLQFKPGVLLMAMMSGAPIVPVYIKPTDHWYQRLRIATGEPVYLSELAGDKEMLTMEELEEAAAVLQARMTELMDLIENRKSR